MAVWLHFRRINIEWAKPFQLIALDYPVDILEMPPRQVVAVVMAHARRHYDRALIDRLCTEHAWAKEAVAHHYRHGIDWGLIKAVLRGKEDGGPLLPLHRRGLELLICGAFWPEDRRWRAGISSSAECVACRGGRGDEVHRIHDCDAMVFDVYAARARGSLPRIPEGLRDPRLAPLLVRGLPPKPLPWTPVEVSLTEGDMTPEPMADIYGDGSGYLQEVKELRRSTWAIVRAERGEHCDWECTDCMRGGIGGWFPTVPRGELSALIYFMRHSGPGARFITDCQAVADGMMLGVPESLTGAASFNADLWRKVREGLHDRGAPPTVLKTKAHRSRSAALCDAVDHEGHWAGNNLADKAAKELAKSMVDSPCLEPAWFEPREAAVMAMRRIAFGVAWALQRWPEMVKREAKPLKTDDGDDQDTQHVLNRRADGGVECVVCRRVARTLGGISRLRREMCGGSILHLIDGTHTLRFTHGITWCSMCSAFTSRWPRFLLQPCRRRPWAADRRNILRRLLAGLPPPMLITSSSWPCSGEP